MIYKFEKEIVTTSTCGKYGHFDDKRWLPVKYKDNKPYLLKVHSKKNGCPDKIERFFLVK